MGSISAAAVLPAPFEGAKIPLSAETLPLQTAIGERRALVITPNERVSLAASPNPRRELSVADRWILEQARSASRSRGATVCIFRGTGRDGACYRFDEELEPDPAAEIAEAMIEGQLRAYREMVHLGMCLFVHADFGYLEVEAFRDAKATVVETLRAESGPEAELDRWVLQNLVFFFAASFDNLMSTILPDKLPMMEKRMDRVRRMMERR